MMPPEYSNMPGFMSARMGEKLTIKNNKGMGAGIGRGARKQKQDKSNVGNPPSPEDKAPKWREREEKKKTFKRRKTRSNPSSIHPEQMIHVKASLCAGRRNMRGITGKEVLSICGF
jgi:hypothetical protein